jgi:hypothetical protein
LIASDASAEHLASQTLPGLLRGGVAPVSRVNGITNSENGGPQSHRCLNLEGQRIQGSGFYSLNQSFCEHKLNRRLLRHLLFIKGSSAFGAFFILTFYYHQAFLIQTPPFHLLFFLNFTVSLPYFHSRNFLNYSICSIEQYASNSS